MCAVFRDGGRRPHPDRNFLVGCHVEQAKSKSVNLDYGLQWNLCSIITTTHEETMSSSTSMSSNKPLKRLSLLQSPTSFAFDASALPSPASPSTQVASKSARRQSSIYYLPPDSFNSNSSPTDDGAVRHNRRHSTLGYVPAKAKPSTSASASRERSKRQTTSLTEASTSAALTLVEKCVI